MVIATIRSLFSVVIWPHSSVPSAVIARSTVIFPSRWSYPVEALEMCWPFTRALPSIGTLHAYNMYPVCFFLLVNSSGSAPHMNLTFFAAKICWMSARRRSWSTAARSWARVNPIANWPTGWMYDIKPLSIPPVNDWFASARDCVVSEEAVVSAALFVRSGALLAASAAVNSAFNSEGMYVSKNSKFAVDFNFWATVFSSWTPGSSM